MTFSTDLICFMARQAGGGVSCIAETLEHPWKFSQAELERFAALVAAKEREACAQVCESTVWTASIPEWRDMTKHDIAVKSMLACAAAIRARGTKEGA